MEFEGKQVTIIGASQGLGKLLVGAFHQKGAKLLAVARGREALMDLASHHDGVDILALDASADNAPDLVFTMSLPDILIVCGGAIPPTKPLQELDWETFSINWQQDVKMSFLFIKAALNKPLKPGSAMITISSGAAIGGSPISGGFAGAKRMQMFLTGYAQKESQRLGRNLRFLSIAPMRIMPETRLEQAAIAGYAKYLKTDAESFVKGMGDAQTAQDVANAVVGALEHPDKFESANYVVNGQSATPIA